MEHIKILFLCIMLTGCANTKDLQHKTDAIVNDKFDNAVVFPSEEQLAPCPDKFTELKNKSFGDLIEYTTITVQKQYDECKDNHKVLSDFIKEVYKK